jgi:hypothetical protein
MKKEEGIQADSTLRFWARQSEAKPRRLGKKGGERRRI